MSHDIFVQDLPPDIQTVDQIPDDFRPRDDLVSRLAVLAALRAEAPHGNYDNQAWAIVEAPDEYYIEVNMGDSGDTLGGFAFHVSGGLTAYQLVARVLDRLQLRALDPESDSGLFQDPGQ